MKHDVFVSYSTHDKVVADATCAALEAKGIRCWIAPRDGLAGTEYGETILNAIEGCRAMVLVFSAHANESLHVRREVERALSKGKFILPFRIENVLPSRAMEYFLGNTHWLDALTPPLEMRIGDLVASVGRLLNFGNIALQSASGSASHFRDSPLAPAVLGTEQQHEPSVAVTYRHDGKTKYYDRIIFGTDTAGSFWLYSEQPKDTRAVDSLEHVQVANIRSIETPQGGRPESPFSVTVTLRNGNLLEGWAYHYGIDLFDNSLPAPTKTDLAKLTKVVYNPEIPQQVAEPAALSAAPTVVASGHTTASVVSGFGRSSLSANQIQTFEIWDNDAEGIKLTEIAMEYRDATIFNGFRVFEGAQTRVIEWSAIRMVDFGGIVGLGTSTEYVECPVSFADGEKVRLKAVNGFLLGKTRFGKYRKGLQIGVKRITTPSMCS